MVSSRPNIQALDRDLVARLLIFVAFALMAFGAYRFTQRDMTSLGDGLRYLLIGIPFFWGALWLKPTIEKVEHKTRVIDTPLTRFHAGVTLLGIVSLFAVSESAGERFFPHLWFIPHHIQFLLLVIGWVCVAWGMSGGFRLLLDGQSVERWRDLSWEHRSEFLILGGLFLLALVVRVWNIGSAIPAFVDEINFLQIVNDFDNKPDIDLLRPINTIAAFPRLYPYLQWWTNELMGRGLDGLRVVSAFFGALTVPVLYMLGRELFDRRTALIAALFLVVFPPHLQFSRLGMNNVADPVFGMVAFVLLLRGLKYGGRLHFALAGVCLGLTQYFYEGGRFVFPAVTLIWLMYAAWRSPIRPSRNNLFIFLASTVITAAPVYYTLISHRIPLAARAQDVGLKGDYWSSISGVGQLIADTMKRFEFYLSKLFVEPEKILYYSIEPYIHFLFVPLIALGAAYVTWHWYKRGMPLVILWLVTPTAAIVLLLAEVMSSRIILLTPALCLLAAAGLHQALLRFVPLRLEKRLLFGTATVICFLTMVFYFGYHVKAFALEHLKLGGWQEVIFDAAALPPNTEVDYVFSGRISQSDVNHIIKFLKDDLMAGALVFPNDGLTPQALEALNPKLNHAFFVHQPNEAAEAALKSFYPDLIGPILPSQSVTGQWFLLYFASARP